jgi:hypothetical protein
MKMQAEESRSTGREVEADIVAGKAAVKQGQGGRNQNAGRQRAHRRTQRQAGRQARESRQKQAGRKAEGYRQ